MLLCVIAIAAAALNTTSVQGFLFESPENFQEKDQPATRYTMTKLQPEILRSSVLITALLSEPRTDCVSNKLNIIYQILFKQPLF